MPDAPTCIFCDTVVGPDTKPEHILLSALGGRKTTRRVICSEHNQDFGGTIDDALAAQVAFIRNQLQLESGVRKPPPGLGEIQAGARTIKVNGDGTPQLVGKPFEITPLGDGSFQVRITTNSVEQLERFLPHIAAKIGITEEHLRTQLVREEAALISQRPDVIHRPNPLGGELECRSMLKSCLVLWATKVGNVELKLPVYKAARDYVITGGAFKASLDSRPLPSLVTLTERYGDFFNLIYVKSDAIGRVLAHFTLYNIIAWRFVLAESGGMPNHRIALVSNPLKPSDWCDVLAAELDLDLAWLECPDFDASRSRDRLAAVMARAQRDGMERELGRIVGAVWEKHNLSPEAAVDDPRLANAMLNEIVQRFAFHVSSVPYEEKISGADLLALTKKKN